MFGKSKKTSSQSEKKPKSRTGNEHVTLDVKVLFLILFVLSVAELGFTLDSFIYLQRKHKWYNNTERARLGFLIFSAVRMILLSAVYLGFSKAQQWFHSMLHTIFLFLSTVFWIVSGVIIHSMYGYKECGGVGDLKGGLNECHEIKIVEILAWVIAGVSVLATIPVVYHALQRRKRQAKAKHDSKNATSG